MLVAVEMKLQDWFTCLAAVIGVGPTLGLVVIPKPKQLIHVKNVVSRPFGGGPVIHLQAIGLKPNRKPNKYWNRNPNPNSNPNPSTLTHFR